MANEWIYTKSSLKHQLWLVFDTGLSVTPLMGHLGYLSIHWSSVPVTYGMRGQGDSLVWRKITHNLCLLTDRLDGTVTIVVRIMIE